MQFSRDPNDFLLPKPDNWDTLTLSAKIQTVMQTYPPSIAPYVDKLQAKQIVKDICGDRIHVAKVHRILDTPDDLQEQDMHPDRILKSTHASGWNISFSKHTVLPDAIAKLHRWNRIFPDAKREIQYSYITPRFFIEEKVNCFLGGTSLNAAVFMIRCIYGIPQNIRVVNSLGKGNSYTLDGKPLGGHPFHLPLPSQVQQMIELAKDLSAPFEFVRVDFYLAKDGRIFFSEFTFSPGGGTSYFPEEVEAQMSAAWTRNRPTPTEDATLSRLETAVNTT